MALIVGVAIFLVVLGLAFYRYWNGSVKRHTIVGGSWLFPVSRSAKNAMFRGGPSVVLFLLFLFPALCYRQLFDSNDEAILRALDLIAILGLPLSVTLWQTVIWFNQPKFLVFPAFRGEWGLLALNARRRRIRRFVRANQKVI